MTDFDRPISVDTPCIECRYNLRGLTWASRCPECGTATIASARFSGHHCRFDPALTIAEAALATAGVLRLMFCLAPLLTPVALALAAAATHALSASPCGKWAGNGRSLVWLLASAAAATAGLWIANFVSQDAWFHGPTVPGALAEFLSGIAWFGFLDFLADGSDALRRNRIALRLRRSGTWAAVLTMLWAVFAGQALNSNVFLTIALVLLVIAPLPFIDAVQGVRRLRESINAQERLEASRPPDPS